MTSVPGCIKGTYGSRWDEFPGVSVVIFRSDNQERAFTKAVVVLFEDSFLSILLLTSDLVPVILTLEMVVALEILLQTNLLPSPFPIPK